MTAKSRDIRGPTRYNNDKPARERPPGRSQARTTRTRTPAIRIARTETVTMTPAQHDDAIEALAVLITRWHHDHPGHNPDQDRDGQPVAA